MSCLGKELDSFKRVATYRVLYVDTDAMGVVYYGNYLKLFELGRAELMRLYGMPYSEIEKMGILFPVVEVSCKYKSSAFYDDILIIKTKLSNLKRASLRFEYVIEKDGFEVASGFTTHACLCAKTRKVKKIPDDIYEKLKEMMG